MPAPRPTTAFTDIDFEREGKQVGFINIPHSPHTDAWGVTRIPLTVIKNGEGPTLLLEGGNHGDEYEGPIALGEIIRTLDPTDIRGRLIIIPAINIHAVNAGQRVSPVDGLNYNRTLPGDPTGTITMQIAAYVADYLMPISDAFVSLHSGGSSLDILPSAIIEPATDAELRRRNLAAVRAFGAPIVVVIDNLGEPRTATATAVRQGLVTVGTEMGGGGTVSLDALAICRQGVRNVMAHLGITDSTDMSEPSPDSALYQIPGKGGHLYANAAGVFEPLHKLGAEVRKGEPAGRVHFLDDPAREPLVHHYGADGILYGRRQPGRVVPGNCCAVVASPYVPD